MRPAPRGWLMASVLRVNAPGADDRRDLSWSREHHLRKPRRGSRHRWRPCLVEGNLIGTNAAGTAAVPNGLDGIAVASPGATIGGTSAGAANIISGNANDGVDIEASCLVEGNLIGTNAAAPPPCGNGIDGIIRRMSPGVTIGGTSAGAANIISGNAGRRHRYRGVMPGRGQPDRHQCGWHRRGGQRRSAFLSVARVPRSAGPRPAHANIISGNG